MALPHTHLLDSQVGGHAGVLTTEDGSLLIKPALNHELAFYRLLQEDESLQSLRHFTPNFLGTLKLEGRVDTSKPCETGGIVVEPIAGPPQKDEWIDSQLPRIRVQTDIVSIQSIVLENLSFPFLKPNILDIKLGTVLYGEGASADKIARMEKTARNTTSFESGIRLTGFQVYDNVTNLPVNTPKTYGKTIQVTQLGEGIAKFFPVGSPARSEAEPAEAETAAPAPSGGLPRETLLVILRAIRDDIAEIRETFETLELRMVGGSLLIIYEADWARAADGLDRIEVDEEEEGDEEEEEDDDEDDEDDDADTKKPGPPYIVKLIDFAHTRVVPGQGPDRGVLLGFDTTLRLLDARLEQITSNTA